MAEMSIRELRDQLGLSQKGFAHALSVEVGRPANRPIRRNTVATWEAGQWPSVAVAWAMVRMAERVGIKFRLEHALPENGQD